MMKRIVVPLDGSSRAEQALAVAEKLARATNSTLILVQAYTLPMEFGTPFAPAVAPSLVEETERSVQEYLTRQARQPMLSGLTVETDVRMQSPALAILNATLEHNADLIVMTSHGRTGLAHWVLGSVAEHVVRQATAPVLVLREHELPFWIGGVELVSAPQASQEPQAARQALRFSPLRVLVPLDGSVLAEQAVEPAATWALALVQGAEQSIHASSDSIACQLHLVLVVRPYDTLIENMPEALVLSGAEDYLKKIAARLHATHSDITVTWEIVAGVDVADTLITIAEGQKRTQAAKELEVLRASESLRLTNLEQAPLPAASEGFTLLAMATHGRTGVLRWVWGSITERVVQKTTLPVLLVRPHQPQQPRDEQQNRRDAGQAYDMDDISIGGAAPTPQQPVAPQPTSIGGWVEE
jgi:nucleotide-binding universal stress UspA family protein